MNVMESRNAHGKKSTGSLWIHVYDGYSAGILCLFFRQKLAQTFRTNQTGNPSNGTFRCVSVAVEMRLNDKPLLGVSLRAT